MHFKGKFKKKFFRCLLPSRSSFREGKEGNIEWKTTKKWNLCISTKSCVARFVDVGTPAPIADPCPSVLISGAARRLKEARKQTKLMGDFQRANHSLRTSHVITPGTLLLLRRRRHAPRLRKNWTFAEKPADTRDVRVQKITPASRYFRCWTKHVQHRI